MGFDCKCSLRCFGADFVLCLWMDLLNRVAGCMERGSFLLPDKMGSSRLAGLEYLVYFVWEKGVSVSGNLLFNRVNL